MMLWLKLIWWAFWRGLLYGGITGVVLGILFAAYAGAVYGVLIGTIMGAALGLLDGLLLAGMTRLWFNSPSLERSRYIGSIRIVVVPIDFLIAFIYLMSAFSYFGIIPAAIISIAVFAVSPAFADYTIDQLKQIPTYSSAKGTS